jgi:uncharacterized protein YvpB
MTVKEGKWDLEKLRKLLQTGAPVIVWYVHMRGEGVFSKVRKVSELEPLRWNTWGGQKVEGYVGQHTALVVGMQSTTHGKVLSLTLVQGHASDAHVVPVEVFESLAAPLNQMLWLEPIP